MRMIVSQLYLYRTLVEATSSSVVLSLKSILYINRTAATSANELVKRAENFGNNYYNFNDNAIFTEKASGIRLQIFLP